MKVLLTHAYFLEEDSKEQLIMKPYVPLGLLYISAFLEERGVYNEVYDTTFGTFENQKQFLIDKRPDVIAIYCNLMTKLKVIRLMEFVRSEPSLIDSKIILGGPEIRHNAMGYLNAGADLLVMGEGEQTFFEVCKQLQDHGQLPLEIDGTIVLNSGGQLQFNKERALIKDINTLPMPARHKIDLALYGEKWKKHHQYRTFSISTMRGCPYTCKWCSRAVYGGTYRRRSPALVAQEMQLLFDDYQAERLWFVDDVFTISHKWLREFVEELKKRSLYLPYEIITRADRMTDEVIALLKESGCFRIWIGAESGSQRVIDAMDRRVDVTMVREMIIKTKQAGMEAGTFIMLGYPGETRKDILQTIEHLRVSAPTYYTVTIAYPITGTPLFEEVKNEIIVSGAWDKITDRELDFKRTKSKQFYHYAVRWVNHELHSVKTQNPVKWVKHKAYSLIAQMLMFLN